MNLLLSTLNSKYIHASLGIYSLSAYLSAAKLPDIHVELREYTTQTPLLNILADMQPLQPDIIALAVYIWNKDESMRLTKVLKTAMPGCTIVLGGPEVSFNAVQVLADNPEVDYIVQGEGEIVFAELVQFIKQGGNLPTCVSCHAQTSDSVYAVSDLNTLPFAYTQFSAAELANKIIYYESSRGCPYACSYCLSGISRHVRYKDFRQVTAELGYLISRGVKQVKFVDRTYNLDAKHYLPIMQFLAAQDTDINFHFEIKADLLTDEVLAFLRTVPKGRFQFEVGIQTTSARTLQAINRVDNWHRLAGSVHKLLEFGNIHVHVDLIAGLPYEDLETFKNSFNNVHSLWADMLQLGFLKVLHGSTISGQICTHGYKYMPCPPYEVLSNNYISYTELRQLKLIEDLLEKYHNSGRYKHTLRYLLTTCYCDDAFAFYEQFAHYLESQNQHLQSLSSKNNLQLLLGFIEQNAALRPYMPTLYELLHLDTFVVGENWRNEFFAARIDTADNKDYLENFWRDNDLVGKYLPDYRFTSWRQVKKIYRMEEFVIDGQSRLYIWDEQSAQLINIDNEDFYRAIQ
mgnify:CR=1 FL=1